LYALAPQRLPAISLTTTCYEIALRVSVPKAAMTYFKPKKVGVPQLGQAGVGVMRPSSISGSVSLQ
jgi:hypothetical protein